MCIRDRYSRRLSLLRRQGLDLFADQVFPELSDPIPDRLEELMVVRHDRVRVHVAALQRELHPELSDLHTAFDLHRSPPSIGGSGAGQDFVSIDPGAAAMQLLDLHAARPKCFSNSFRRILSAGSLLLHIFQFSPMWMSAGQNQPSG